MNSLMSKAPLLLACLAASVSLSLVGCGDGREKDYKTTEAALAAKHIDELERLLAACESKDTRNKMSDAEKKGASEGEILTAGGGKDISIGSRNHEQEIVLTIDNAILFKPGKAELTSQAKGTLARAATILNERYAGDDIRIDGFTDNQAITRSKDEWADNWALSAGRSHAVLKYLIERGVSAKRLGFAGYADNKAVASNGTDAGRAKNRRVEIVVLPNSGGGSSHESSGSKKKSKSDD